MRKPQTRSEAIKEKCTECIYDPYQKGLGGKLQQIADCTSPECPLFDFRPLPREAANDNEADTQQSPERGIGDLVGVKHGQLQPGLPVSLPVLLITKAKAKAATVVEAPFIERAEHSGEIGHFEFLFRDPRTDDPDPFVDHIVHCKNDHGTHAPGLAVLARFRRDKVNACRRYPEVTIVPLKFCCTGTMDPRSDREVSQALAGVMKQKVNEV